MATAKIAGMVESFKRSVFGNIVNVYNNGRHVGAKNRDGILEMLNLAHKERNQERINYYQTMLDVMDGKRK
jgi:hypothetical protein